MEKGGGEVTLRMPVRNSRVADGAVGRVEFEGGWQETADAYVFALPHPVMGELASEEMKRLEPRLGELDKIGVAPITGVHFWFDREVMKEPFVTLLDTTTQWIFNKTALYGGGNGASGEKREEPPVVVRGFHEVL